MVAILLFFFRSLTGFVAVFLVRGFAKVRGEWSLMALCYNFSRVLSILGFDRWLAVLAMRTRNPRGMLFLALATVPRQLTSGGSTRRISIPTAGSANAFLH